MHLGELGKDFSGASWFQVGPLNQRGLTSGDQLLRCREVFPADLTQCIRLNWAKTSLAQAGSKSAHSTKEVSGGKLLRCREVFPADLTQCIRVIWAKTSLAQAGSKSAHST